MSTGLSFRIGRALCAIALTLLAVALPAHPTAAGSCLKDALKHLLDDYSPLSVVEHPQTIGVEVEGMISNSIGRKGTAEALKAFFEGNPEFEHVRILHPENDLIDPHVITYRREGRVYHWEIKSDVSVEFKIDTKHQTSVELTTPILRDGRDLVTFRKVMEVLKEKGFRTDPNIAGIHVHVGFPDARTPELLVLTDLFSRMESELFNKFSVTESRLHYAQATHEGLLRHVSDYFPSDRSLDDLMKTIKSPDNSRNRALNLLALEKFKTVEFRLFNSTIHPEQIEVMIDFTTKLVTAVRTKDARLLEYLARTPTNQLKVMELAKALDMKLAGAEAILDAIGQEARHSLRPEKISRESISSSIDAALEAHDKGGWLMGVLFGGVSVSAFAGQAQTKSQ